MSLRRLRRGVLVVLVAAAASWLGACRRATQRAADTRVDQNTEVSQQRDNFGLAMDLLAHCDQYEPTQVRKRILSNLNQWIETQRRSGSWQRDPLLDRLPEPYQQLPMLKRLGDWEFTFDDVDYLIQAHWVRQVAQWAALPTRTTGLEYVIERAAEASGAEAGDQLRTAPDPLAAALEKLQPQLDRDGATQLAICMRLFDWTVRNIQLDPLLPLPKERPAGPLPEQEQQQLTGPLSAVDQPGPGYQHYPWQVLLYGHGDAWERARLFIHLARQLNIDVVMLGVDETARTSRARAWLPAVLIGGQLYLFDTSLGLPIPGPDGQPVATLAQLVRRPQLLRALDIEDDDQPLRYPLDNEQLKQIVALVDAPLPALSRRMQLVEQRLVGQQRLVLTLGAAALAQRVLQCEGVNQAGLWTVPLHTSVYRSIYMRRVARGEPQARRRYLQTEGVYLGASPLVRGRWKYFRGIFDSDESQDVEGAKSLFLSARMSNELINKLTSDPELQQQMGLVRREDESQAQWNAKLQQLKRVQRLARTHAAYFLALAHFESGNYADAANWIHRTQVADADGIWKQGARYNLARCYEALGKWPAARELYETDQTTQQHGNRLRLRLLDPYYGRSAAS